METKKHLSETAQKPISLFNLAHPIIYLQEKATISGCTALRTVYRKIPWTLKKGGACVRIKVNPQTFIVSTKKIKRCTTLQIKGYLIISDEDTRVTKMPD